MKWIQFIKKSIHSKLLLSYLFIILIPLLILGTISYRQNIEVIKNKTISYNNGLLKLMAEKVENYIFQIEQISYTVYQDTIYNILTNEQENDVLKHLQNNQIIAECFTKWLDHLSFEGKVNGFLIINMDGSIYYNGNKAVDESYDFRNQSWFQEALERGGEKLILSSHQQPYLLFPPQNPSRDQEILESFNFSLVRKIINTNTPKKLGVVMINVSLEEIDRILKPLETERNTDVVIIDNSGNIIYALEPGKIGQRIDDVLYRNVKDKDGGSFINSINNEEFLVSHYYSEYTGWRFIFLNRIKDLLAEAPEIKKITILLSIISLVIASGISVVLSYGLVKPIKKLQSVMFSVESGNLNVEMPILTQDEIGDLSIGFNNMIAKIRHLIQEVYQTQIKEKEAQLNALQAQINPHFLYNTLETISSIAQTEEIEEISSIAKAMSKMFRYSTKQGMILATFREEIEHTKSYLEIQSIRYADKFEVEMDFEEDILDCKTLKLILQPMVENAIYHGIELKPGKAKISISIKRNGDCIQILIKDDGLGMSQKRLDEIRQLLSDERVLKDEEKQKSERVGLKNVHDRIRLYFGQKYGLTIESEPNRGTTVSILVPVIRD